MKGSDLAKTKLQNLRSEPERQLTEAEKASTVRTAETLAILHKWGIHTLGQLAALDKEEIRDRLGADAVRLWERANGTATRLLKLVQPPETFEESFEFDHEIETAEPLLFILRRFLEQFSLRLSSIYLVARELTLTITFSGSSKNENTASPARTAAQQSFALPTEACSYERNFKIPQPTNDVDLLFRMLQTHLENFKSDHPIVAVALIAEPVRPASQQFGLFETALKNPQQLYETLARLSALLGNDRVGRPVLEETHRPDAFRMEAFAWCEPHWHLTGTIAADTAAATKIAGETPAATANGICSHRPLLQKKPALRRFRPPASTSVFVSDGRYLESDKVRGQIVDQRGPFLFSGNWWDEKSWARAEWDMQLENGELIRAHETPPSQSYGGTGSADGTWKIDGIYD